MSRREAIKGLKPVMAVYNLSCVAAAGYCMVGVLKYKLKHGGSFACNATELKTEDGKHLAWVVYVFYAQKFWEFIDTWLFILNKNFRQLTFLHIFHHSSVTIMTWAFATLTVNGDTYLPVLLNSTVHVLMYTHYFICCLPKSWGLNVFWRSYLTKLQLGQFVVILIQSLVGWYIGPHCGYPDFMKFGMILYMFSMLGLFANFFINRYVKPANKEL